ncbi:MAG TPA: hypothetical protein VIG48_10990 [Jatrophihabitans sp.]|jgi:Mce-associated membrane protein
MTDDPDAEPTPAQRAALDAAKAAKKARKAQEKADRLAAEYRRLSSDTDDPPADTPAVTVAADPTPSPATRTPLLAAAALLVACLAFLVVAIVVHARGGSDSSAQVTPTLRDQVLLAARQDVVVLNSLDYRAIDRGLTRWRDASTGQLRSSFDHVTPADRTRIAGAKAVTTARILEAAVVSLDPSAGQARIIASVELTVTPANGKAVVKRERQQADLQRIGSGWKVSGLQQVGVTVS